MASTPLQPRQTAWGRACVVDTASTITPQTGRCQACRAPRRVARPAAGRPRAGRGQPQYGDDQAFAGLPL